MASSIPCSIIFNTKQGYIMAPIDCESIRKAEKMAEDFGMAYRIFDHSGKLLRRGWKS